MTIHGNFIFYNRGPPKARSSLAGPGVSVASAAPVGTHNMPDCSAALGQILAASLTFAATWWRTSRYEFNPAVDAVNPSR